MPSELEKLANAVRQLANEAGNPMRVLGAVHTELSRLSARAAALGGSDGARVQELLSSAMRGTGDVTAALTEFDSGARGFADRLVGGGAAGVSRGEGERGMGPDSLESSKEFPEPNRGEFPTPIVKNPDPLTVSMLAHTATTGAGIANPGAQATAAQAAAVAAGLGSTALGASSLGSPVNASDSSRSDDELASAVRWGRSPLALYCEDYPGEFIPPKLSDWPAPTAFVAHSDPNQFVAWTNDGGRSVPGRNDNCVNCAMATQSNWSGDIQVSAARAMPTGELSLERLPAYYGKPFQPARFADIEGRLTAAGPGASAIVRVRWDDGRGGDDGGHCFNAVNYRGTVYFVDGQAGWSHPWPPRHNPSSRAAGYGESDTLAGETQAMFFDPTD